jgi:uncharacterized protein YlxW (UPF0749 family)
MGNENKVTDIVQRSKELFLPDELRPDEQQHVYSLNEEFAKSRKNRSYLFVLKVVGFLVIIVALAYFGANFIEMVRDERMVEITEFEDLRLRDIFDSTSKYQTELNTAREGLDNLRIQMQDDILNVKNGTSRERESLLARHLSPEETETQMKKIREREDARINAVKASYQRKLDAKDGEIRTLNQKITEANKDMNVNVQKAESIMGNYQKLHNIKMDRQRAAYERQISELKSLHKRQIDALIIKYNPVFRSARIQEILKSGTGATGTMPHLSKYSDVLRKERAFSKADFDSLRKNFESYTVLMERMLQIPYENSVPPSLAKIDSLSRKIADDYEKLWISLVSVIIQKNRMLQNYRHAFEYHGTLYPENGFIIDAREKDAVRVQLSKIHTVKSGDTGLVFRDDDEYIGKIEFVVTASDTSARILELAENKKLKPFDKILIKYRKEQP